MRCQKCGSYSYDRDYRCLDCGHFVSPPSISLGSWVDDAQPPSADSGKENMGETKLTSPNESDYNPQLGLLICPRCIQRALFWNRHAQIYRCVNPKCKQSFTIDEYKKNEVQVPPEERRTEQTQSDVPTTEAKDETEPGTTEQIPFDVSTTEAKRGMARGATEQMPSGVPMIEAKKDEIERGITEQTPSDVPITKAKEETERGATEQIPSNISITEAKDEIKRGISEQTPSDVPTIEAKKDEIERGITEQIPSNVSTTKAKIEMGRGIKAGKQMNRNLAFLLIGVLAILLVILGAFLWQKAANVDELSSQLEESRRALTDSTQALQTQLAASQQDVKGLTDQLAEAQQKIEAFQAEINKLKSPPLTPSQPFVYSGGIYMNGLLSFPIELKQFEKVQGEITAGYPGLVVYIQDSTGGVVKDLGRVVQSNLMFTAQMSGSYTIVIKETSGFSNSYTLKYTIYRRQ